jgi:hypothetical protein
MQQEADTPLMGGDYLYEHFLYYNDPPAQVQEALNALRTMFGNGEWSTSTGNSYAYVVHFATNHTLSEEQGEALDDLLLPEIYKLNWEVGEG